MRTIKEIKEQSKPVTPEEDDCINRTIRVLYWVLGSEDEEQETPLKKLLSDPVLVKNLDELKKRDE